MPSAVIVEDDAALGELFASVLAMNGFEAELISDSRRAIEHIRTRRPDLVTLDLQMPHVSGVDILRALRADASLRGLKVIVVSANAHTVQQSQIEQLADIVLLKPVSFDQLSDLAARLIAAQQPATRSREVSPMIWYNEPRVWRADGDVIVMRADPKTDFWRITRHAFIRDNGHFYHRSITGDFTLEVRVSGAYRDLYDQAGVMLRTDPENWIKCGIELVDGVQQASAVVTRVYSDWSVVPLAQNPPHTRLRVQRIGDCVLISYALDDDFMLLREAYFPPQATIQAGLMCAAPQGNGFEVRFDSLRWA